MMGKKFDEKFLPIEISHRDEKFIPIVHQKLFPSCWVPLVKKTPQQHGIKTIKTKAKEQIFNRHCMHDRE